MATHPVLQYRVQVWGKNLEMLNALRFRSLRGGIKDLLNRGRVVISARWTPRVLIPSFERVGCWVFETVYIGRKAIRRKGIRHQARVGFKEFNPNIIPY